MVLFFIPRFECRRRPPVVALSFCRVAGSAGLEVTMKSLSKMRAVISAIGLGAAASVLGCPVYSDDSMVGPRCVYATDCPLGYRCTIDGFCVLAPPLNDGDSGMSAEASADAPIDANPAAETGADAPGDAAADSAADARD
jgi:hypothetical protein